MLEIKGAFRVTKTAFVSTHYAVLVLNDSLVFARTGSELTGADVNSVGENTLKRFSGMSKEEIISLHKKNFEVHYDEIISLKLKKSPVGFNGARTGVLTMKGKKVSNFDLSPLQDIKVIEHMLQAAMPGKLETKNLSVNLTNLSSADQSMKSQATQMETADKNAFAEVSPNQKRVRNGASWLFVIAAFSLINTILLLTGSDRSYVIGLAFTQFVAAFAKMHGGNIVVWAIIITVVIAAIFAVCGLFARKGNSWAFVAAIFVYLLDTCLFLIIQDWLSMAFHILALCFIFYGTVASFKLKKYKKEPVTSEI
jgi:hypothetical protein